MQKIYNQFYLFVIADYNEADNDADAHGIVYENVFYPKNSKTLDAATIPDLLDKAIVYRYGYGNLKTFIKPGDLIAHQGQSAVITINRRQIIANVRSAIFGVPVNHFSFAPGSTVLFFQMQRIASLLSLYNAAGMLRLHTLQTEAGRLVEAWR